MNPDIDSDSSEEQRATQTPAARWLKDRAIDSTDRALSMYTNGKIRDFFLFAGQAIELACKALLADKNIAFLAPIKDSKFLACDLWKFRNHIEKLPAGVTTIGAKDAIGRLVKMNPFMRELQDRGVTELFAQRNSEVHLGIIDPITNKKAVTSFVKAMNLLFDISEKDFDWFWAPHDKFVRTLVDDNTTQIQLAVQLKISAAIERFQVIQLLPSEQRDAILLMIQPELEIDKAAVKCPACHSVAIASGTNEIEVGDVSAHRDGTIEGIESWLEFTPFSLLCPYCGLPLENRAELEAAGIESSWIHDDENVKEAVFDAVYRSAYQHLDFDKYEDSYDDEQ